MEKGIPSQAETSAPLKIPWFPWIGKRRPFYGWVIVLSGTLAWFANNFPTQSLGAYFDFLQKDFGWNRATLAGARSVMTLENATLGPLQGMLVDKLGARIMVAIGVFISGLGLILKGFMQSLWMYYATEVIIVLGGTFVSPFIVSVAITHWFRRKRSVANGIIGLGLAIAVVLGVPAVIFVQNTLGWRTAFILTGFVVWLAGIPAVLFFRRSPELYGLQMDGDVSGASSLAASTRNQGQGIIASEPDFTLREALRTKAFWYMAVGQAMANLGFAGIQVHVFLYLQEGAGLSRTTAGLIVSITGIANMVSRLLGGFLGDRISKRLIVGTTVAIMGVSIFVLAYATSLPMALAYAVLYGIGWGARVPVFMAMQGDYFGRRAQGAIRGWMDFVSFPLSLAAPVIAGYMADVQGTYRLAFVVMAPIILIGGVVLFLATPPKVPLRRSTISDGGQRARV